jgi:hypothetical protein
MKSRWAYVGGSVAVLLGAGLALDCGSSGHAAGSVGGACLASGVCNSGLVCLSQICVQPTDAGAGGTGGAGGGIGVACTAANTMAAPSNRLIADFSGPDGGGLQIPDGGLAIDAGPFPTSVVEIGGQLIAYPLGSASAPAYNLSGGALHVTVNTPVTSAPQYVGMFLGFTECIDATAFTGVSFTISGSLAGCTVQFETGDVEHTDSTVNTYLGTGAAGSYPPQFNLDASQITTAPQTLMMLFTSANYGNPQTPTDKTKLIDLIWQFVVPPAASSTADAAPAACVGAITIDNVSFY